MKRIVRLTESDLVRIVKKVLKEDTGQSDIMNTAMKGDFLREKKNIPTPTFFQKLETCDPNLSYKNFLTWHNYNGTTDYRVWGEGDKGGTCSRALTPGGKTNENGQCMEDVVNFVRAKSNIMEIFNCFR